MNKIICGDSAVVLKKYPDNHFALTVTSPPYDDNRKYKGHSFDFETIAQELFRVTKPHGCVCWNVSDTAKKGNESLTSFRQALYFQEIGFNVLDTMIIRKTPNYPRKYCYPQAHEYVFVLTKEKYCTFNPIMDHINTPDSYNNTRKTHGNRQPDGTIKKRNRHNYNKYSARWNIWEVNVGYFRSATDKIAYKHPAIMAEKLARDLILSWSNPGDLVLDPFAGSGTTLKMAKLTKRDSIGIEISQEYCDEIIKPRLRLKK